VKRSTNGNKAKGPPPGGDELPKQDPTPSKSAPDLHVFDVPVPNYNLETPPTIENKKTWWRWDFALLWRKVIFPIKWRLSQWQRYGKNQLNAIWKAILHIDKQSLNINVIRSAWRRVKKDIIVRDLKPVTDVKGGGGVKGESKPTTGGTDTTGSTGSH
jgi:hypothetical protein